MAGENGKKTSSPSAASLKQPKNDIGDRKRRRTEDDQTEDLTRSMKSGTEALQREMQELRKANNQVLARLQNFQTTESVKTIARQKNQIARLEGQLETQSLDWLQNLMYPRTSKYKLPLEDIEEYMIGLESAAEDVVTLMTEDEETFTTKTASISAVNNPDLFKFMQSVVVKRTQDNDQAWKTYVKRGVIVASVSAWVFDSPFPMSRKDDVVEEMQKVLTMRGGEEAAKFLEYLRQDARYYRSRDPDLVNVAIPNRAEELTLRLANAMAPFVSAAKDKKANYFSTSVDVAPNLALWLAKIKTIFLTALNFFIRLQQQSAPVVLYWPKEHSVFDSSKMRALNAGSSDAFVGSEVIVTVMPAAMVHEDGTIPQKVFSKAVVYLRLNNEKSASNDFQSGRQLRQVADIQYSEDIKTVSCSSCGINKLVFDVRRHNQICGPCMSRLESSSIKSSKGLDGETKPSPSRSTSKARSTAQINEPQTSQLATNSNPNLVVEIPAARSTATAEPETNAKSNIESPASDSDYDEDSDASFKPPKKMFVPRKAAN